MSTAISEKVVIVNSQYWNRKEGTLGTVIMSDNVSVKVVTVLPWQYMMNLYSIFCKIDANSSKLFVLLEPHSSFRFQYRLLTMTTFFEIAVYVTYSWDVQSSVFYS